MKRNIKKLPAAGKEFFEEMDKVHGKEYDAFITKNTQVAAPKAAKGKK